MLIFMPATNTKFWLIFGPVLGLLIGSLLYVRFGLGLNPDLQQVIDLVFTKVLSLLLLYCVGPFVLKNLLQKTNRWIPFLGWFARKNGSKWVYWGSWLIFAVPLVLIALNFLLLFTWYEGIFPGLSLLCYSGIFLPPALNNNITKTWNMLCVNLIGTFLFMFFGFLNPLWMIPGFFHGLHILILFDLPSLPPDLIKPSSTSPQTGKSLPLQIFSVVILIGMISSPVLVFAFQEHELGTVTLPAGNEPEVMFVDWTWEYEGQNPRYMTPEILDAIEYCNNLDRIDVSITVNLQMDYVHGDKNQSIVDQVRALLDRGIRVNIMPFNPKYPTHYYVNAFTVETFNRTYQDFKEWMHVCGFDGRITTLIVDLEPLIENVSVIFDHATKRAQYQEAVDMLTLLVDQMKAEMHPLNTSVIGAAFGYTAIDVLDLDDSIFRVLTTPTFPPMNWDAIGFMNYFFQPGSDYAIYSSLRMMDHYYGKFIIPYIISTQSKENMLTQFKIIRNFGYNVTGIWALHQFLNHYQLPDFIWVMEQLNIPSDVTFEREGAFIPTLYTAISLLDLLVFDPWQYSWTSPKTSTIFTYQHA
jgi:hypothetical protein